MWNWLTIFSPFSREEPVPDVRMNGLSYCDRLKNDQEPGCLSCSGRKLGIQPQVRSEIAFDVGDLWLVGWVFTFLGQDLQTVVSVDG